MNSEINRKSAAIAIFLVRNNVEIDREGDGIAPDIVSQGF
jgi:hypothetical protein